MVPPIDARFQFERCSRRSSSLRNLNWRPLPELTGMISRRAFSIGFAVAGVARPTVVRDRDRVGQSLLLPVSEVADDLRCSYRLALASHVLPQNSYYK